MTNPSNILKARGIYNETIRAGWVETENFWEYPVIDHSGAIIAYRQKKYPHAPIKGKKYLWKGKKPHNPDAQWYILPKGFQAIKNAGIAYVANGEPALLAFHAAGIDNVLATTLSEIAFPEDGAKYLQAIGVNRLIYIADSDEAGLKSAVNWRDALSGTGIDLEILAWPEILPEKSDANDALMLALAISGEAGNEDLEDEPDTKAEFQKILKACYTPVLPASNPKPKNAPAIAIDFDKSGLVAAIHKALEQGNYTGRKIRQQVWLECHCPFHDDKEASAGFNIESGVLNCFGKCGRAFSPRELTEHFRIDWKLYYPQAEGKKKPKKAELSAFEASLATIPSDSRDYMDIISDEIMARDMAYCDKQYIGFGQWQAIPLGVLSAVMTLCNGRSNTGAFLGRLQSALIAGKLPTFFDTMQAAIATNTSYHVTNRCLAELEHLSFLTKLRGVYNYIDSIPRKDSAKNSEGRPKDIYMVELERSEITGHLLKMLEIFFLEKHAKKALAMPSPKMAGQLGLDEKQYRAWLDKVKAALGDPANKQAKQAYDMEFLGNGGNWKGWIKALESKAAAPLDYASFEDTQALRAGILSWWISKVRDVNSREELCRLLGCTDPVIDKVMAQAAIISEKQMERREILKLPETVKGMAFEYSKIQRELHGYCWRGGFWDTIDKAWIPFDSLKDCLDTFSRLSGRISKAYMLIQKPSKQRLMTEDELAQRNLEDVESEVAVSQDFTPKTEADKSTHSQDAPRMPYTYQKWDKHSYAFLYRQLQLLIHCYTPCKLEAHNVLNKQGQVVASGELKQIATWYLENASATPQRRVKSFYGKGYDEDVDFAALQALADERKARLGIVETIEIEDEAPIQQGFWRELETGGAVYVTANEEIYVPF